MRTSDDEESLSTCTRGLLPVPPPRDVAGAVALDRFPASAEGPGCAACLEVPGLGFVRRCCGSRRETAAAIFRPEIRLCGFRQSAILHASVCRTARILWRYL